MLNAATIANLSASGLLLERHYTFRFCSPSRRSFLSGRSPLAITTVQPDGDRTCSDFLPLATTTIAEKLTSVGYACHFIGKGHLGYQTTDHLPANRGFDSHIGYLAGAESYAHGVSGEQPDLLPHPDRKHDMWLDHSPGYGVVEEIDYSADFYGAWVGNILRSHAASRAEQPLWVHFPIQNVHAPVGCSSAFCLLLCCFLR